MTKNTFLALVTVVVFSVAGIVGYFMTHTPQYLLLPLEITYLTLLINTFVSVRFFLALIRPTPIQVVVDSLLIGIYVLAGLFMGNQVFFILLGTCLFIVAAMKYVLLINILPYTKTLKNKIAIDIFGAGVCATTLGGTILGYPLASAWALAGICVVANIYFLLINPMYAIKEE